MEDKVEERGLRAKINEHLSERYPCATVKKVLRILDGFPSVERFCRAGKAEWLQKYREAKPRSHHDIGLKCIRAIEDTISFVNDVKRNDRLDLEAKIRAEESARAEEERANPKFTLAELKAVVNFMDLCEIAAIDLRKIKEFLGAIEAKIKG